MKYLGLAGLRYFYENHLNPMLNKKATYYKNVEDMKADSKLKNEGVVVTLGLNEENDGGGAMYYVAKEDNGDLKYSMIFPEAKQNKYVFDFTVYAGEYYDRSMEEILAQASLMGFSETQMCININASGYVGESENIKSYISICDSLGIPVKTLKIHTNNSFVLDTEENRTFYNNTLASLIEDIDPNHEIDTLYVMNEKESIYSTCQDYMNLLIGSYKMYYKVGITFTNQINALAAIETGSVVKNCDVIGVNLYPSISAQNVSDALYSESEIAWNMLTGRLQKIYDYCNENEIELQCTETGCIPYEGILSAPWYWDITNTDFVGKQNFNAIKIFLHGLINNVQVKNYFTKIGFWFVEEYYTKFSWTRSWFKNMMKGDFIDDR